ncbi:ATP-binding protein [Mucilaginibacter sp. KACC 22063]|uniref:ATP-binding protein n=1 Tax=Mucilaginibacter sp. KACC 22063 TaxID=3025666 RepID=UPI002367282F|nr:ATP-binding protein [Mucilaginibacter sp. KACC 22063]WDF53680.1 ATP-binding protein [Mucilaginibacter sp. KACC 22063]
MVSELYFLNDLSYVPATLLDDMLNFIRNNLPQQPDHDALTFKTKFILTELITNAVKHTPNDSSSLQIRMEDDGIRIIKTDTGNPLNFKLKAAPSDSVIASDFLHTLYVKNKDEQLHFYCVENHNSLAADDNLPEHFGLLIITKSSDTFYYHHNKTTGVNTFNVFVAY